MSTLLQPTSAPAENEERFRALERQARILQTTLSAIVDFAYIFDRNGRFIYSNQALLDLLGITVDEIVGRNFFDLRYPDDLAARLQRQIQEVIDTKSVVIDETPYTSPSGTEGYYEYIFAPVLAPDGSVEVVAGSTRNITERKRVEKALQVSEEYSRHILESINEAFFAFDKDLRFTYVNKQAERLLGRAPDDLLGKIIWEMYPGLLGSEFEPAYRAAREQRASSVTAFYPDHNRWYEVHAYPAPNGITVYFRDVTGRTRAQEELRRARDELEVRVVDRTHELERTNASLLAEIAERKRSDAVRMKLLQRLVNAQEEERRRISREMHDSLGQHLTALTLGLKSVQTREGCPEPVREHIEQLRATALQLDEEIDRLSYELRPPALDDLGLAPALRRHAQAWSQETAIPVEVHIRGIENERLPAAIETTVYRIAQEALTNIRKHANATLISILTELHDGLLRVIIEDNGSGFDPETTLAAMDARRLGLKGMSERVSLLAGQLEIESAPGRGTTLYLSIPLARSGVDIDSPQ